MDIRRHDRYILEIFYTILSLLLVLPFLKFMKSIEKYLLGNRRKLFIFETENLKYLQVYLPRNPNFSVGSGLESRGDRLQTNILEEE